LLIFLRPSAIVNDLIRPGLGVFDPLTPVDGMAHSAIR
jgi:hypothetical protein